MSQIQSLMYLMVMIIPVFIGITLLIVWRHDPTQKFVRDFALSNFAFALVILSFDIYLQKNQPYSNIAFWVAVLGAILNILYLVSSITRLARVPLGRYQHIAFAILLCVAIGYSRATHTLSVFGLISMSIQICLGLAAIYWFWKKDNIRRSFGPLLILLGCTNLIILSGGDKVVHVQGFLAALLRAVIGFLFLYSALNRTRRDIRKSMDRFRMMTEQSPQGVLVFDYPKVVYSNEAAQKLYGRSSTTELNEAYQRKEQSSGDNDEFRYWHQQLHQHQLDVATWSGRRTRFDGKCLSLTFTAWRIEWDGEPATQVLITDETELIDSAMALHHKETHDELTGLPNRRVLIQHLNKYCYTDENHFSCMLTILNINRFKLFNQGKGHVIGDQVLIEFAKKLKDGVGAETEVMRLGGDEFGLVSINLREIEALNARIDAICKEPILVGERDFFINVAIGQAIYPLNALNADGLLRAANAAMHQAKQIPGTSLVLAEARFEESLTRAMEQEQALKSAILNREICLFYQPKVDARTHRLVGFEALARWIRPGVGIVSPVEFIAVAEKTALISDLGTMLLSDACSQIAAWTAEYGHCVPVGVNVSPIQLLNANFVQMIAELIESHGIPARLLTLEITESAAINDMVQTQTQVQHLLELGVLVAMDDFGTGYSSLSMLRQLPLQTLKIDRALIDPLPAPDAMAVVTSICQIAQALNMQVVAEGVETELHATAAKDAGCHELQGYLFARPMNHLEAGRWLSH